MDVTCERCGTEYEFDETLLSGRGTSVKCTNCGHVFRVYPAASGAADRTTSNWRLQLKDGSTDAIDTLRELQRRISSGELTPDDQIARGDDEWKTLGSIPELETFFQAAGIEIQSNRIPSPLPPVPSPRTSSESSLPPGKRPRQPTLLGVTPVQRVATARPRATSDVSSDSDSLPLAEPTFASVESPVPPPDTSTERDSESVVVEMPPPDMPEASYRSPYTRDSVAGAARAEAEDAEFEESPRTAMSVRTSTPPPGYYDDDDDIPDLPGRGTSPLKWLLLIVLVGGVALVAAQWQRVALLLEIGSDPALIAAGISEGDAALAEGHPAAYASAIEAYRRAMEAGGDADEQVLARLSKAYALAAQARLDQDPDANIEGLSVTAMTTAQAAVELKPRSVEAQLALVDAMRLEGASSEAREQLEEVRAISFSRTAEFFRVDARLSAAEADGRLENGLRSAREAERLDPEGVRYSLLAARAELAAGNTERARALLERVLEDRPEHPVAAPMLKGIELAEAEAQAELALEAPEEPLADAGVEAVSDTEAPSEPEPEAVPASPSAPSQAVAAAKPEPTPQASEAKAAAAEPKPKKPEPVAKAAPAAKPARRAKPARKEPAYDEYDRLAAAAKDDAFVDGRPPVLDYEANMTKGRKELAAGNHARARAYFDSALEVHPGSADAMDALGDVATSVSDYASALRYYRVAAQRGQPDGYFKLGQTYERLGKNEEAVSAYYTYVKRRPKGTHAAEARDAIRTLEPRAKLPPEPEPDPEPQPENQPEPSEAPEPSTP